MSTYRFIKYESAGAGVVRIMLDRPERRNAQNRGLLVELGEALERAESDDAVRVVILGGTGTMFSSGHDLGSPEAQEEWRPGPNQHPTYRSNGATRLGAEARQLQEWHYFFENTRGWRNLRKITIAEVVGARLGMCGGEYLGHPWEFGPRKAKELMLTGDGITAEQGHRLGMVNKVFPRESLTEMTDGFPTRVAAVPTVTALLVKESVNQTLDCMGFTNALNACFTLHQLNHAHWAEIHEDGYPVARPSDGVGDWKEALPVALAAKDRPVGGPAVGRVRHAPNA